MNFLDFKWTHNPSKFSVFADRVEIITDPHTDLWQRTYYHFCNDNAPLLQYKSKEKFFTFTVKCDFEYTHRFDQCGIAVYLDSDNWIKASIEYENEEFAHLGSVVTNHGYSDWSTTEINAAHKTMWYRLSRREDDFKIENSYDGINFKQMRVCNLFSAVDEITFGVYACSPETSSFRAVFSCPKLSECIWPAHDGQKPDY